MTVWNCDNSICAVVRMRAVFSRFFECASSEKDPLIQYTHTFRTPLIPRRVANLSMCWARTRSCFVNAHRNASSLFWFVSHRNRSVYSAICNANPIATAHRPVKSVPRRNVEKVAPTQRRNTYTEPLGFERFVGFTWPLWIECV